MSDFTNRKVSDTYKDLLQVPNSNSGITGSLTNVQDGEGTSSILQLSTAAVNITGAGTLQYGGTAITATAAEINVLDGYTGSVTELNYLDTLHATGVTATEFDYLDGVTSNIQTQLDSKIEATLTSEQVQDIVGAMFTSNTETRISASYQDADGTIDLVVDDMTAHPSISAASSSDNSGRTYIQDITLDSNGHVTGIATATETVTDTNLSTEAVQDIVGAMVSSNTETGITVSYEDGDGTLDFVVATQTDNNFTTTLLNKLNAIEASATADQTDAEIRTAVENASDSNVFTDADHTKLNGIEASADVTDTDNVRAADALMDDEVDADLKTFALPANTTISTFGKSIVDDADAAAVRTTIGVDAAGTDNSTNVTLAGSLDYITLSGQEITRNAIDLAADVTGTLPVANGGTGATSLNNLITLSTHTTGNYVAAISGTSNEIEVSGSGSEGATVTVGLPDDVTIGGDLSVTGALTVNGSTTTLDVTNLKVTDNLIELNQGVTSNANDSGIIIERGSTGNNAIIMWDESADKFVVGTTTATADSTGNLTVATGTLVAAIEGNASTATTLATGRDISLTGDVTGTTATTFDGSGNVSIATSIANNSVDLTTHTTGNYVATLTAGALIDLQNNSGEGATPTIDVDLSELTDGTDDIVGSADELVYLDDGNQKRKLVSEIKLSQFNNDTPFLTSVPNHSAALLTSGTVPVARLSDIADGNLASDAAIGNSKLANSAITIDGTSVSLGGSITTNNTQLSTEQVQDIVGAMFTSNTETRITAEYQDGDGTIDLVVDDMTADTNTNQLTEFTLTADSGSNQTIAHGNTLDIEGGTGIDTVVGATDKVTVSLGNHSAALLTSGTIPVARISGISDSNVASDAAIAITKLAESAITIDGTSVSLGGSITTNNTQLSTENVQDIVGAMFTSNTETRISVEYQDGDGTIDLVVDDMTANDNTMGSGFVIEDGDGTEVTVTENKEVKFVEGGGIDINWTDVDNGTDADPYDLTFTLGNHSAALLTSGTLPLARLADISDSQIASDAAIAISKLAESQITIDGTAVSLGGSISTNNTQLSTEQVQDIVGGMFTGNTETRITATYQDGDGTIDLVVDDMTATGSVRTVTAGGNTLADSETLAFTAGSNVTISESGGAVTIAAANDNTNQLTTFQLEDGDGTEVTVAHGKEVKFVEGGGIDINWTDTSTGSDGDPYDLTFTASGISDSHIASDAVIAISKLAESQITIDGTAVSLGGSITTNNTQLSTEQVQDIVGAMFDSNTETRISATYQDGDGTIDLVVDDMTTDTNTNQLTTFTLTADSGSNQTIAHGNTLDIAGGTGISTSVGSTDTVTVTLGNHSADLLTSGTVGTARLNVPSSGDWFSGGASIVATDGVMEIGRYIDFHNSDTTTDDYHIRLDCESTSVLNVQGGTLEVGGSQVLTAGDTIDISSQTNLSAGTNITLSGDTLNVDDAFLKNNADDTTSGTITAGGFTTTGTVTAGASSNQIRLRTVSNASPIADTFSGNTEQSYIDFLESTSSNDPGFIMHETNDDSETNEGVIHLCPSDDNAEGDYISIHGTNDADKIKLHTSGKIEGVTTLVAEDLDISGDVDIDGTTNLDAVDIDGVITAADGSASAPQYSFGADTNSGMFRVSSDVVGIAVAGNSRFTVKGNGIKAASGSLGVNTDPNSTDGMIHATNDIVAFSSDKRLKENIRPIENALDKVSKLSGFVYNWNELANEKAQYDMNKDYVGVYAQDVEEVQPEAVDLAPFDNDGEDKSISGDNYLTVQYEKLVPLLIESIKELKAEIEELKK